MDDTNKRRTQLRALAIPLIWITATLTISDSASCQEGNTQDSASQRRGRIVGVVYDKSGKPWVDANVELTHRPHSKLHETGHVVRARTDERGRFRARIDAGKLYGAWAWQSTGAQYRRSKFVADVVAGVPCRLEERDGPLFQRRIHVAGLSEWKDHAPLSFAAEDRRTRPVLHHPLELDESHTLTLPPLPGDGMYVSVRSATGRPIQDLYITRSVPSMLQQLRTRSPDEPSEEIAESRLRATETVQLAPPHSIAVRCIDRATKGPISGARIMLRGDTRMPEIHEVARTGEDGVARFVIAAGSPGDRQRRFRGELVVFADGYAELDHRGYKIAIHPEADQRARHEKGEVDVEFALMPGGQVRGRLLLDADTPVSNASLLLYANVAHGNGVTRFGIEPRRLVTDDDGRFLVPGRSAANAYRVSLILDRERQMALSRRIGAAAPVASEVIVHNGQSNANQDLGDIRLDEFPRIHLTVRLPDGSPARATEVLWIDMKWNIAGAGRGFFDPHRYPLRARSDRQGRVTLLTCRTDGIGIFAGDRRGFIAHETTTQSGRESLDVELVLDSNLVVTGRLLDADDKPLANASISLVGPRSLGANERLVRQASAFCSVHALRHTKARTDATGRYTLVLPMRDILLDLSVYAGKQSSRVEVLFGKDSESKAFDIRAPNGR